MFGGFRWEMHSLCAYFNLKKTEGYGRAGSAPKHLMTGQAHKLLRAPGAERTRRGVRRTSSVKWPQVFKKNLSNAQRLSGQEREGHPTNRGRQGRSPGNWVQLPGVLWPGPEWPSSEPRSTSPARALLFPAEARLERSAVAGELGIGIGIGGIGCKDLGPRQAAHRWLGCWLADWTDVGVVGLYVFLRKNGG